MMLRKTQSIALFSLSLLSLTSAAVFATPSDKHMIVTKTCLGKTLGNAYAPIAIVNDYALLSIDEKNIEMLALAKKKSKTCGGFVDVGLDWQAFNTNANLDHSANAFLTAYLNRDKNFYTSAQSYTIRYEKQVNEVLQNLNSQNIWNDLTTLTSSDDRYANSENGVKAAEWFKSQIELIAKNAGRSDVEVFVVETGGYKQPSVVAKIGNSNEAGVLIGGHIDTLSSKREKKPGADDDGSGSTTVLETARVIINSGKQFKKPIYVAFYAAEEMGLVGSSYVVKHFQKKGIQLDAVMQLDMTGYAYKNDPTLYLMNDYVNKKLTAYLETLVNTYVKQPVKYTHCGYACSDHASWHAKGYPASMPFEGSFNHDNPYIHTSQDTMDHLSLTHMQDFAKLAVAFAVELAEPVA